MNEHKHIFDSDVRTVVHPAVAGTYLACQCGAVSLYKPMDACEQIWQEQAQLSIAQVYGTMEIR